MISPLKLVERMGPGGRLVPFFKFVAVYFVLSGGEPSAWAVALKCAPVLWLAAFVALAAPHGRYARRVLVALLCSAAGDALLLWEPLFVVGMVAFAAAHACYLSALGFRPLRPLLALGPGAGVALAVSLLRPPAFLALAVPPYSLLLATVAWRAMARVPRKPSWARLAGAAGAIFFLISDSFLGCDMFYAPLQNARAWVMSTYYLAQLGFALSVLDPTPDAVFA